MGFLSKLFGSQKEESLNKKIKKRTKKKPEKSSSEKSNEISNFNKFGMELGKDYEEDIDFTHRNITLEDEKGHFFGSYYQSKSKKYLVAYSDASNEDEIPGQVYLIKDEKRILWKKDINRPNSAFVNDAGIVVIIDWISFGGELAGKIHFFDKTGKKLLERKVDSNIGGQAVSDNETEIIITTCNPENAFYLFDIKNQRLVKKVKNTSGRPEIRFDFNEMKKKILKADEFDQQKYDSEKLEQERSIEEEEEGIKKIKKKSIEKLDYGEVVQLGVTFSGNFYGEEGNPKLAIKYLLEAVKRKKDKPQPFVLKSLGFCYEKLSEFNKAIDYYNLALKRYPSYKKSSPILDHIDFCKNRLKKNKKFNNDDWTDFICERRG